MWENITVDPGSQVTKTTAFDYAGSHTIDHFIVSVSSLLIDGNPFKFYHVSTCEVEHEIMLIVMCPVDNSI